MLRFCEFLLGQVQVGTECEAPGKLRSFRGLLQVHLAVSLGFWAATSSSSYHLWVIPALVVAVSLTAFTQYERSGLLLTVICVVVELASQPPNYFWGQLANHNVLEYLALVAVVVSSSRDPREAKNALGFVGGLTALAVFYGGMQKVWCGAYFNGQYLTWMTVASERFRRVFEWALPESQFGLLTDEVSKTFTFYHGVMTSGPVGPFVSDSVVLTVAGNLVWFGEVALALGLLLPGIRRWASGLLIFELLLIQLAAREVFFGLFMVNVLTLFFPQTWRRRIVPMLYGAYLLVVLSRFGVVPFEVVPR